MVYMSSSIGLNELGFKLPTGNINDIFGEFIDNDDFMNLFEAYPRLKTGDIPMHSRL